MKMWETVLLNPPKIRDLPNSFTIKKLPRVFCSISGEIEKRF